MLDINFIRQNPQKVKEACEKKNIKADVDAALRLDAEKRKMQTELELLRSKQNKLGKDGIDEARRIKEEIKNTEPKLQEMDKKLNELLLSLPNIPFDDVPVGPDESGNKAIRQWGEIPKFDFKVKDHMEIGEGLDIIDTKKASQISGARFGYLKGDAALLEYAILQHTFSILTSEKILKKIADKIEKGYSSKPFMPIVPPVMIKPEVYKKMARLSDQDKDERYYLPQDDLYLIGSAEHTLGPLHMEEILDEKNFPIRYIGFSTSFRREAGSYGKDTKGILRVHQFDKIEMESFCLPENSRKEQDFFVAIQEYLVQSLKLPYQVMAICTGDMGKPDARQLDIETWMPGQNRYRETHTSDLMTDYQARRLNTKVKRANNKTEFVHMNDATAFAIGRILIAILENYQQKDGTVKVPQVLQKYFGKKVIGK